MTVVAVSSQGKVQLVSNINACQTPSLASCGELVLQCLVVAVSRRGKAQLVSNTYACQVSLSTCWELVL